MALALITVTLPAKHSVLALLQEKRGFSASVQVPGSSSLPRGAQAEEMMKQKVKDLDLATFRLPKCFCQ